MGGVYPVPLKVNPLIDGKYRCYSFVRRPPGPNLEIREYTLTIKQDVELTSTPGVLLMPGSNWSLREGRAGSRRLLHARGAVDRRIADPRQRSAVLQSDGQAGRSMRPLSHVYGRLSAG